jgi:predicted TIM-barrel fold metal-dependent hydrolase
MTSGLYLDRRQFLAQAGAVVAGGFLFGGCTSAQVQPSAAPAPFLVDVHCHVFNAADLPVRGFIQRVALGDEENQVPIGPSERAALPWLAAVLIEMIGTNAKTADAELAEIQRGGAAGQTDRAAAASQAEQALTDSISAVLGTSGSDRRSTPAAPLPANRTGRSVLLSRIDQEIGRTSRSSLVTSDDAREMARGLLAGNGAISRYVQWVKTLLLDRRDTVSQLISLYAPNGRSCLFTPALIDFSYWLEDEPRSDLESQIRVMEMIQRSQAPAAVRCFVPFDPWRQLVGASAAEQKQALELVKWAIEDMGFLGVKLYPPMGFKPTDNARVRQSYPKRAKRIAGFPARLDGALGQLYEYAQASGVPIMAHTAHSNGAAAGYSDRASPQGWRPVLQRYPKLSVNFAHFGGFEQSRANPASVDWEILFSRLIKELGNNRLFADMSYLAELLPDRDPKIADHVRRSLRQYVQANDSKVRSLMYGSDWIMLGKEQAFESYESAIAAELTALPMTQAQIGRFFGGNAIRYLGLKQGQVNRQRIDQYNARHALSSKWLEEIDALPMDLTS